MNDNPHQSFFRGGALPIMSAVTFSTLRSDRDEGAIAPSLLHRFATQAILLLTINLSIIPSFIAYSADFASRPNILLVMTDDK
jgi:hypothetical protein